jgi:hypothetical protein
MATEQEQRERAEWHVRHLNKALEGCVTAHLALEAIAEAPSETDFRKAALLVEVALHGIEQIARDLERERDAIAETRAIDPNLSWGRERGDARFRVGLPIEYHGPSLRGSGTTWDISTSGVRIDTEELVDVGTTLQLRLRLPSGSELPLTARVVRQTESGFAARFLEVTPEQDRQLREALTSAAFTG